ncbi:MAG: CDP-glucose 4,6-dehydratase, partial [Chloroflexota bacterium]
KGAWLTVYLKRLGAEVIGYALEPPTKRNLFERAGLEEHIIHNTGDVRNMPLLAQTLMKHRPDFIFHMAAQPLVLEAYRNPVETFEVNVMGSIALMEAVRQTNISTTLVMVTTDKVYENNEWDYGYRETDSLGGHDPYSASKAAMEIAVGAYMKSFFSDKESKVRVASVRSGNVIGGGDWAENRIVPDAVRALSEGRPIPVRNPRSTRPWQHVLEPLTGYLWLGAVLEHRADMGGAWNFGPTAVSNAQVRILVELMIKDWGKGSWEDQSKEEAPHEAKLLKLSIDKANSRLAWQPAWNFRQTIRQTVRWYKSDLMTDEPAAVYELCERDIAAYIASASAARQPYTRENTSASTATSTNTLVRAEPVINEGTETGTNPTVKVDAEASADASTEVGTNPSTSTDNGASDESEVSATPTAGAPDTDPSTKSQNGTGPHTASEATPSPSTDTNASSDPS